MTEQIKRCMATHPMQPNHSGHSRGRKVHATIDNKRTICNMLVDNYWKDKEININTAKCKICFNPANKAANK